jgi:transcriptional regulator with XRE-family HTH domain
VTGSNALGEYLRARRELVDPADVGLRVAGVRRTPGLRREEVATLAGISADYYLRLEQGRDRNPSSQVLGSLARVFGLDGTATQYLLSLSAARPARPGRPRREVVPAGIRQLLAALELPAFVESRMFDVIAANRLATALSPSIRPGENRLRSVFLDHDERDLHPEWEQAAAGIIASFRASIGTDVEDPGSRGSSASCRWPVSCSGGSGRATTSGRSRAGRPGCATHGSGCCTCAGRSCPSGTPAASSW